MTEQDAINLEAGCRIGPKLMVWWVPQVPMTPFKVMLNSLSDAKLLLEALAQYDLFQLKHNIKPDFSNAGGVVIWDEGLDPDEQDEKWCDFYDDDGTDIDNMTLEQCVEWDRHYYNSALMQAASR